MFLHPDHFSGGDKAERVGIFCIKGSSDEDELDVRGPFKLFQTVEQNLGIVVVPHEIYADLMQWRQRIGLCIGRKRGKRGERVSVCRNWGSPTSFSVFLRGAICVNSFSHWKRGYVVQPLEYSPILIHLCRQKESGIFHPSFESAKTVL